MARTDTTRSEVIVRRRSGERYIWPDAAINIWVFIMLVAAGVLIGVFAQFINVQNHFLAGIPWLFPFGITVGALTVLYIVVLVALISSRRLLPVIVIVLSFILFALFLTGFIETSIQLFGSSGVNKNCQQFVIGTPVSGPTLNTLAWLQQQSICQSWYAVFSFWIVGGVFLIWLIIIASTVNQGMYE